MRKLRKARLLAIVACFGIAGCAVTRDISNTPEYAPWIGKTVKLAGTNEHNVFAPIFGSYFIDSVATYGDYRIAAKLPPGYPVVIESVHKTEGTYILMGNLEHWEIDMILSIDLPGEKNKRIKARADLNQVEPFEEKRGSWITFMPVEEAKK